MQLEQLPPQPWDHILKRLRQITSQNVPAGCAVVTMHVLVKGGQPVMWNEPEILRLEPRSAAQAYVALLLKEQEETG